MSWLRVKDTPYGTRLRVGGHLPPLRARIFRLSFLLVAGLSGFAGCIILLVRSDELLPYLDENGIPPWTLYLACLLLLIVPSLLSDTIVAQRLGEVLIGKRFTVKFHKDKIQIVRFFIPKTYNRESSLSFDVRPHPSTETEMEGNQKRLAKDATSQKFQEYRKTLVVVMRHGIKVHTLASIYDRHAQGLGHRAEQLVQVLQDLLASSSKGSPPPASKSPTPQYGHRPSV